MSPTVHLDLRPGFTGIIDVGDVRITVRGLDDVQPPTRPSDDGGPPADRDEAKVQRILEAFTAHTPEIPRLHQAMVGRRWEAHAPKERRAAENEKYVRLTFTGSEDNVTLYLNTQYLECAGKRSAPFAATLTNVHVRPNGNVYIYFAHQPGASVTSALAAVAELEAFANGQS